MNKTFNKKWLYLIIAVVLLALVKWCNNHYVFQPKNNNTEQQDNTENKGFKHKKNTRKNRNIDNNIDAPETGKVPQKVIAVWNYVKKNGEAMPGYVGGREFKNREKKLPIRNGNGKLIQYQEWDVNPKVKGVNRGAERLVTDDEGNAYFTDNHYKSFIKIE